MTISSAVTDVPDSAQVFDPEQEPYRGFQQEVARFIAGHFGIDYERARFERGGGFDAEAWRTLAENGWLTLGLPEAAGGLGDIREVVLFQMEAGKAVLNTPFVAVVVQAATALAAGNSSVLGAILSEVQTGATLATTATGADPAKVSFRGATSDLAIAPADSAFQLSGELKYVHGAQNARWLIAHATDVGGSVVACWPMEGATLDSTPTVDGSDLWRVRFDGSLAAPEHVIATGDNADRLTSELGELAALAVAAEAVGGADGCFSMTADYVKNRVQFGRPVGSFQAVKHRMADLYLNLVLARNLVFGAVDQSLQGDGSMISMAKAYASELYLQMVKAGAQLHAGIGYTWDHNLQFYIRRALTIAPLYGDIRYHRSRVADSLRERALALK